MARRRRRRGGFSTDEIASRQRKSIYQLALTIVLLVMLLALWDRLSEGAAGCVERLATPPGTPGAPAAPTGSDPGRDAGGPTSPADAAPPLRVKTGSGDAIP